MNPGGMSWETTDFCDLVIFNRNNSAISVLPENSEEIAEGFRLSNLKTAVIYRNIRVSKNGHNEVYLSCKIMKCI